MESLKEKIKEMEREEILNALRECDWVMAKAARKLGITERMIGYKIKKYGVQKKEVEHIEGEGKGGMVLRRKINQQRQQQTAHIRKEED